MALERLVAYTSTKKRVEELEKKRGPGNIFKRSPLPPKEEEEFNKKRRKLRIWKRNERKGKK